MQYTYAGKIVSTLDEFDAALADGYLYVTLSDTTHLMEHLSANLYRSDLYTWAYAYRLLAGEGCEKNADAAFPLLLRLAENRFTPAYPLVAVCYATGNGTPRSAVDARIWAELSEPAIDLPPMDEEDLPPTVTADEPAADAEAAAATPAEESKLAAVGAVAKEWGARAWAGTKKFLAPYKFTGFHLEKNKTTVSREIIAGITTFFAMAYILFVQPNYLSQTGMPAGGVMIATCFAAAIGTILTAFLANLPFAQAPGMGLNAFFTYTLCFGMGYTWAEALALVFLSGFLFLIIAASPLRSKIIAAIPAPLKAAISAGIGLFITFIGLLNADIVVLFGGTGENGANGDYSDLGNVFSSATGLAIVGLIITSLLLIWRVRGAVTLGILATTLVGFLPFFGQSKLPTDFSLAQNFREFGEIAFAVDFGGAFTAEAGLLGLVTAVISLLMVDMFDTVGTLLGTAGTCKMLDEDGNFPDGDRALVADAIATCTGAFLGSSTVTTFVESSTGMRAGGRTGLTSLTTGSLFLLCIFLAPIAGIVPAAATAPAMIIVGVFMMKSVLNINWDNLEETIPCFLTIVMMPFAYSISDGIAFGMITWCIFKLARGKAKEVKPLTYVIAAIFLVTYLASHLFI